MYVLPGSLHELLAILKQGLKKGFLVTDSGCVDRGQMTSYLEFVIRIPSLYMVNLFTRSNTSDNGRQWCYFSAKEYDFEYHRNDNYSISKINYINTNTNTYNANLIYMISEEKSVGNEDIFKTLNTNKI